MSYESYVTLETTKFLGNLSLLGVEMMDLDKEMFNNGKNNEDFPGVDGR